VPQWCVCVASVWLHAGVYPAEVGGDFLDQIGFFILIGVIAVTAIIVWGTRPPKRN
jgi:hypothetical protein